VDLAEGAAPKLQSHHVANARRRFRRRFALAVFAGALFASPLAGAQSAKGTALQLFDDARALMAEERIPEACAKFAESQRVQAQLGTLLHLADCQEKLGQATSAWTNFREALEIARQRGDQRVAVTAARVKALEPRVSRLNVRIASGNRPQGLEILVNGTPLPPPLWGTAAPIDAGTLHVEARAPGHTSFRKQVNLREGDALSVDIPLLVASAPAAGTAPVPASDTERTDRDDTASSSGASRASGLRTAGFISAGAGAVGLGLSVYFYVHRNSLLDEREGVCPDLTRCTESQVTELKLLTDDAKQSDLFGKISFVTGAALAAGGIVMILVGSGSQGTARTASLELAPAVGPGHAGLSLSGRL
jgi:hypothetical protein